MLRRIPVPVVASCLFVLLASGCVPPMSRTPLADAHRKAIVSSKTIINAPQEEIGTSIEVSRAGGAGGAAFGIFGAIIGAVVDSAVDNSRAKTAESGAGPLRDAMVGFDPRATIEAVLAKELTGVPVLEATKIELRREGRLDKPTISALLDEANTDAVLLVTFDYRLSPKFDHIVVSSVATIFPTKAAAEAELKALSGQPSIVDYQPCPALYRNFLFASFAAPNGGGLEAWSANGGEAAKAAVQTGISDIARMLAWDLEQPGPTASTYDAPGAKPAVYKQLGELRQWSPLETKDGRIWLRARTGELASIPEAPPAPAPAPAPATTTAAAPTT